MRSCCYFYITFCVFIISDPSYVSYQILWEIVSPWALCEHLKYTQAWDVYINRQFKSDPCAVWLNVSIYSSCSKYIRIHVYNNIFKHRDIHVYIYACI